MKRSLKPCRQSGCPELVAFGYCEEHRPKDKPAPNREAFKKLDQKKTEEAIAFYRSKPWQRASRLYRKRHELCERCDRRGKVEPAKLTHHKKELQDIWKDKGNPLSWRYLEALCNNCHLEDLRRKKIKKSKLY